jgi:hypothetical protein
MSGTKGKRAEDGLRKRFLAEEEHAIDAVAGWVGHDAVRAIIERHRPRAEEIVQPIGNQLLNQTEVIRFCLHLYGLAPVEPGWVLRKGQPWQLAPGQVSVFDRVRVGFRQVIETAIGEMASAGVGVVPSWHGDRVVVGELLLLDVSWDFPSRKLAEDLQPPAIGAIMIDASGTTHRRGSGERANNNIGALRRSYERSLYGSPPRAPYAGGGTRALPESTRRRRRALAKVLERFPEATASGIYTMFGDHGVQRGGVARTAGGYLRQLLEEDEPGVKIPRPAKTTLYDDLKALDAAKPDQKLYG